MAGEPMEEIVPLPAIEESTSSDNVEVSIYATNKLAAVIWNR